MDVLERLLFENLPVAEKLYGDDDVSDQSEKFLLAEIIREKVLKYVEQELPWATAVYIESIEKRTGEEDEAGTSGEADEGAETGEGWGEIEGDGAVRGEVAVKRDCALGRDDAPSKKTSPPQKVPRKPDPDHMPGVGPTPRKRRPMAYIKASIFVEKDNHRKIVIGRQGHLVKQIGIEARREIEEILETKVYLELRVKVKEEWRDKADVLDMIEGQKNIG